MYVRMYVRANERMCVYMAVFHLLVHNGLVERVAPHQNFVACCFPVVNHTWLRILLWALNLIRSYEFYDDLALGIGLPVQRQLSLLEPSPSSDGLHAVLHSLAIRGHLAARELTGWASCVLCKTGGA